MSYALESCPVPSVWWPSKFAAATMQQAIDVSTLSPPIEASQFASLLVTIEPSGPSELSIIGLSVVGTVVTVTETGGQPRRVYTVTFDAELTNGETQSWIIRQRIAPVLPTDQPNVVPDASPGTPSVWPPYYAGLMASGVDVAVIDTAGWPASAPTTPGAVYLQDGLAAFAPGIAAVPAQPLFLGLLRASDLLALSAIGLPLFDPLVINQLWANTGTSLVNVSAGPSLGLTTNGSALGCAETAGWPTSPAGLDAGAVWLNGTSNLINAVPGASYTGVAPVFLGFVTAAELLAYGASILPTTDPRAPGQLWLNGVQVAVSAG